MRILAVFMLLKSNVSESRGSDCFMFLSVTLINVKIKDEFPVTVWFGFVTHLFSSNKCLSFERSSSRKTTKEDVADSQNYLH